MVRDVSIKQTLLLVAAAATCGSRRALLAQDVKRHEILYSQISVCGQHGESAVHDLEGNVVEYCHQYALQACMHCKLVRQR